MPTKDDTIMVQKATVYDLVKLFEAGKPDKVYTVDEIKKIMDAYISGRSSS